jgi:cell division protein FtsA
MEGAVELAEEIFHMPVRLGAPQYAKGLNDIIRNPIYATAVGLLIYGARDEESSGMPGGGQLAGGLMTRVRDWFGRHF